MNNGVKFRTLINGDIFAEFDGLLLGCWDHQSQRGSYRISNWYMPRETDTYGGFLKDLTEWIKLMLSYNPQPK